MPSRLGPRYWGQSLGSAARAALVRIEAARRREGEVKIVQIR
jgi:hypothetical protein